MSPPGCAWPQTPGMLQSHPRIRVKTIPAPSKVVLRQQSSCWAVWSGMDNLCHTFHLSHFNHTPFAASFLSALCHPHPPVSPFLPICLLATSAHIMSCWEDEMHLPITGLAAEVGSQGQPTLLGVCFCLIFATKGTNLNSWNN